MRQTPHETQGQGIDGEIGGAGDQFVEVAGGVEEETREGVEVTSPYQASARPPPPR